MLASDNVHFENIPLNSLKPPILVALNNSSLANLIGIATIAGMFAMGQERTSGFVSDCLPAMQPAHIS